MVNDLLKELYQNITVRHIVLLSVGILIIDKYSLSMISHLREFLCLLAGLSL